MIESTVAERQHREWILPQLLANTIERIPGIKEYDIRTWCECSADVPVVEVQDVSHHLTLDGLNYTFCSALLEQDPNLLKRHGRLFDCPNAEHAEDRVSWKRSIAIPAVDRFAPTPPSV
jgi:hypothetical protein